MNPTHLFELAIVMVMAIIALSYAARVLRLPPTLALLAGGVALAFAPGLPAFNVNPELVLVIFLPPLLMDGAWTIPASRLRRHRVGIGALAVGAVVFTTLVVAFVAHAVFPALPFAACAALGAIVAPPDAIATRAVLARVKLPGRLQILLEGESLLNDASSLVLFRFAIAAGVTGAFSLGMAVWSFLLLSIGGALVGALLGFAWVKLVRKLGDEYLMIAATVLMCWLSYLLGELVHVSGVIAVVTTGLIASWHQHTVFTASTRMRGTSFWAVMIFLMEAAVFMLIGLSLRGVVERSGGFEVIIMTLGVPVLAILAVLIVSRFFWMFGSDLIIRLCRACRFGAAEPLGARAATVMSWAGVRGVVTLALALSVPADFPGRDVILVTSFAVILGTVLLQSTTLGHLIAWAKLTEPESEKPSLTMSQAESAIAQVQAKRVRVLAHDANGEVIHPMLLKRYENRAAASERYADSMDEAKPLLHAHFDVVLEAVATGRAELLRLHRAGEIDDETLVELERDLDLEELSALSAKA